MTGEKGNLEMFEEAHEDAITTLAPREIKVLQSFASGEEKEEKYDHDDDDVGGGGGSGSI